MDNFFETYLEWIIEKYNDGENISDILTSGYTANTGTYYCPNNDCSFYVLASIETFLKFAEQVGDISGNISGCCTNVKAYVETYLNFVEAVDGRNINYCCLQNKFCIESNFSPQNVDGFDSVLGRGVVELGSSSQIYNTNLCYLFDRLYEEGYLENDIYGMFIDILDKGITIWCYEGIIYAFAVEEFNICRELGTCFDPPPAP